MKRARNYLLLFGFLAVAIYIFVTFYSYIFARKVSGVVSDVQRLNQQIAILGGENGGKMAPQAFAYSVAIKDDKTGEILTSYSEDRRWAVVHPGQCAEVEFFPYPPWNIANWGTWYNARLRKLSDCGGNPALLPPAAE